MHAVLATLRTCISLGAHQSAHKGEASSGDIPACVLRSDEACALTVGRLSNTTSDAMSEAKSPTESLFRSQRSVLGVLDLLIK